MNIGEKIAKARKNLNFTQDQLAEMLEVSRQTVSKWELSLSHPEISKLIRLSEVLNVSTDYLVKDKNEGKETLEVKEVSDGYDIDWSKVYPVLSRYENEIDMTYYIDHFKDMILEAMDKYGYSLEDSMLVLKDVYYKAYLSLNNHKK